MTFPDISTAVLELVVRFLQLRAKNDAAKVSAFQAALPPEHLLGLLSAANYLEC